jgi:hypothetical protein
MNTITGRIITKESGNGIPNLLVVLFDVDPGTTAEEYAIPQEDYGYVTGVMIGAGDRLGSVLTDADGGFTLTYEDQDFRVRNPEEKRPDLALVVLAPEEGDGTTMPTILFKSPRIRQNAGRVEAYFIRITEATLESAGIALPNSTSPEAEELVNAYRAKQNHKIQVAEGIAEFHGEVLEAHTAEKTSFRTKLKTSIANVVSIPESLGEMVNATETIAEVNTRTSEKGVDNANEKLDNFGAGVPIHLYLTPDDLTALDTYFNAAVNGIARIPESAIRPILFGQNQSEDVLTLLIAQNPLASFCRKQSSSELCAAKHLADEGSDPPPTDPPAEEPDPLSIEDSIAALFWQVQNPDSVLTQGGIPRRQDAGMLGASLGNLALQKGPAESPALFDFHSLAIAFPHVWKQLFDEDMVNSGYLLHQSIKTKMGADTLQLDDITPATLNSLVMTMQATMLAEVPTEVATQFEITREEWNDLSPAFREQLSKLGTQLHNLLYKRPGHHGGGWLQGLPILQDPRFGELVPKRLTLEDEKIRQFLVEQGERIIDSVRHDDHYSMHKVLRDLHQRLNGKYEYTVFAADKDYCSVNFGILNTFRQEWVPLQYQAGKLVKTIPLAPKEERKYSLKVSRHTKRSEKETRKNNTSFSSESTSTARMEGEIVAKAMNKTNFNLTTEGTYNIGFSKGTATSAFGYEALQEANQTRKDFREAVLKSSQEIKEEHSVEVDTEESLDTEYTDSGTIMNPNDELSVTYLFYELQKRYRVSEKLHRVMPVVLVAQPVPEPHEITEAWVIAHDWIIRRFLLDDSFAPTLEYIAMRSVGDDVALREMRRNLRQQRNLVETLKVELSVLRAEADNRYRALEKAVSDRIGEESAERTDGWFSDIGDFFGGGGQDSEAAKARELAAKDAHQVAMEKAEKLASAMRGDMDTLHKLTKEYQTELRNHLDREASVKRLLVHLRSNIIYYMQGIWSLEPPDQRFLRLRNVQVPDLQLDTTTDGEGRWYDVEVDAIPDILAPFRAPGTGKHRARMTGTLKKPFDFKNLVEVADLDKPLGFKGNYIIFPLRQHNALTEFMAAPWIDTAFGAMTPGETGDISLEEYARFVCCLKQQDPDRFDLLKTSLKEWFDKLIADPLRNGDEIVVPTGSLFIESLPSTHPILEDFKLRHRMLDVLQKTAEVRKVELENLRFAARILADELEDPETDKKIIVQGANTIIDPENP